MLVSLGEGIYTRSQLKQNAKGRPSMLTIASSNLALAAVQLSYLCGSRFVWLLVFSCPILEIEQRHVGPAGA